MPFRARGEDVATGNIHLGIWASPELVQPSQTGSHLRTSRGEDLLHLHVKGGALLTYPGPVATLASLVLRRISQDVRDGLTQPAGVINAIVIELVPVWQWHIDIVRRRAVRAHEDHGARHRRFAGDSIAARVRAEVEVYVRPPKEGDDTCSVQVLDRRKRWRVPCQLQ